MFNHIEEHIHAIANYKLIESRLCSAIKDGREIDILLDADQLKEARGVLKSHGIEPEVLS